MTDVEISELKQLGEKLRTLRQSKGYSQERFADLTNLDRTYISGLERGKRNPSFLILKRISSVLKIKPSELLGE